jgi:peptidoglycan/LPS O-acetylase OafA/YrhL
LSDGAAPRPEGDAVRFVSRSWYSAEVADSTSTASSNLGYRPGLDGLRAICLLGVFLFHSGFSWMSGGFLGVSTFFTLSGFLLTAQALVEFERTGTVSLARFWQRRMRRLAPAAIVTVAAVVFSAPWWLPASQQERLAGDAMAALLYLVNWRFVEAGYAYELIFTDPSPLQHFWSLAIEAQFYLLYPLVAGVALRRLGGRRGLAAVLVALVLLSVGAAFLPGIANQGRFRLYYGSDTRAVEILLGGLFALAVSGGRGWARRIAFLGLPAFLLSMASWVFVGIDAPILYRGGLVGYALLSGVVVVAAGRPGRLATLLSPGPLLWVGRISYGAYLVHWPIFLVLDEANTGLGPVHLFVARVGLTLALADLSWRWVEEPIRRGGSLAPPRFAQALGFAMIAVVVMALVTSPIGPGLRWNLLRARWAEWTGFETEARAGGKIPIWNVFGDSSALTLLPGLVAVSETTGKMLPRGGRALMGCGLFDRGEYRNHFGEWKKPLGQCMDPAKQWRRVASERDADLALVLTGAWEARDWRLSPEGEVVHLGDPALDTLLRGQIADVMDELSSTVSTVVWLTSPRFGAREGGGPGREPWLQPGRVDRLNEIVREEAARRPKVWVVELAGHMAGLPGGEFDREVRADGTHFTPEGAVRVVTSFIAPEVFRLSALSAALGSGNGEAEKAGAPASAGRSVP